MRSAELGMVNIMLSRYEYGLSTDFESVWWSMKGAEIIDCEQGELDRGWIEHEFERRVMQHAKPVVKWKRSKAAPLLTNV